MWCFIDKRKFRPRHKFMYVTSSDDRSFYLFLPPSFPSFYFFLPSFLSTQCSSYLLSSRPSVRSFFHLLIFLPSFLLFSFIYSFTSFIDSFIHTFVLLYLLSFLLPSFFSRLPVFFFPFIFSFSFFCQFVLWSFLPPFLI